VGTSLAQTLSLMFGGAISLFFLGWSSAFVAVLEQPVDSNSAAMLAALFFYAYWASYVWLGIYIITLSGVTASLVQQRPGATYQNSQKIPLVWAFFCRALRPRHLGVACRWGFVSGTGMLLWTCVTGLRSVFQAPWASPSELRTSQQSGCVRRISLAALPIIQFSHRAILLHVALDGSSIGDARDKTLHLLAKTQRLHGSSADNQLPLESGRLSNDERLQILDDDYYEYAPLIGPGISASFLATMVCGMCILFMVDAAGQSVLPPRRAYEVLSSFLTDNLALASSPRHHAPLTRRFFHCSCHDNHKSCGCFHGDGCCSDGASLSWGSVALNESLKFPLVRRFT